MLEKVKEYLSYNPKSGNLRWIKRPSNRVKVGDIAGYVGRYIQVNIECVSYHAHVLCWMLYYNEVPKGVIDHIDQDTINNKIYNLRDITHAENARNRPKRCDNTSGITGVSWDKASNKWVVRIKNKEGTYENRGRYTSFDEAKHARDRASIELRYHKNHGKKLSDLPYRTV